MENSRIIQLDNLERWSIEDLTDLVDGFKEKVREVEEHYEKLIENYKNCVVFGPEESL